MLLLLPVILPLGLFVPGFLVAKGMRHSLWWASAFPMSLLVLFHCIFWMGMLHIPITLWSILPCLVGFSAAAGWLARKTVTTPRSEAAPPWSGHELLLGTSGAVGLALLARSAISPLIGGDTRFRWDFLAQKLFASGKFDFYPPLTAADFHTYFFVDGIPPLVSFTNWWLYASAGRYLPALICVLVAAQFACTLAFVYGTASAMFSRRAGVLAAGMLAACPLFFRSVVIGQETGLTALAIAAMLYFIVTAKESDDVAAMVSAGLAAALCALSREYGWIALIAGVIALVWRGRAVKQIAVFVAVAGVVAAPWYVRNWGIAGNPFYSLNFLSFTVNPIHAAILAFYQKSVGSEIWTLSAWSGFFGQLAVYATFQMFAGIPGSFIQFRKHGYLTAIALVLTAVWLQSVGYTSGGLVASTRVLAPVLVLLSITGAGLLESLARKAEWRNVMVAAIVSCQLLTVAHGALYPSSPMDMNVSQWAQNAFQPVAQPLEFQIGDQLPQVIPAGTRVLADSAYLHAGLAEKGIDVVPVWSPEVRFLFSVSPEEAERQLRALKIESVAVYPSSLNTNYLASASPFYAALPRRWHLRARVQDLLFILGP